MQIDLTIPHRHSDFGTRIDRGHRIGRGSSPCPQAKLSNDGFAVNDQVSGRGVVANQHLAKIADLNSLRNSERIGRAVDQNTIGALRIDIDCKRLAILRHDCQILFNLIIVPHLFGNIALNFDPAD